MSEPKTNRRAQYTRTALREALIDLIGEKPLISITVTDICNRADINRSTFYLHYKDVDALLIEVENYVLQQFQEQFNNIPSNGFDLICSSLEQLRKMPRMQKMMASLCGEQGDPRFIRKLQQMTFARFQLAVSRIMPDISPSQQLVVYSYILMGMVSVLSAWATGELDDLSSQEVVTILHVLMTRGVTGLTAAQNEPIDFPHI